MNVFDYDNLTDDYNYSLSINSNCTTNENSIDIVIPALLFTIPCGLSFLCLLSFMVYTLIKPLFNKNKLWINTKIQVLILGKTTHIRVSPIRIISDINGEVSLSNSSS